MGKEIETAEFRSLQAMSMSMTIESVLTLIFVFHPFRHHNPKVLRLNNGSFGAAPTCVMNAVDEVRARWLAEPDRWWLSYLGPGMDAASRACAEQFGLEPSSVNVVDNLTVAATIVGDWLVAEALADKAQHDISEVVVLLSSYTYVSGEDAIS